MWRYPVFSDPVWVLLELHFTGHKFTWMDTLYNSYPQSQIQQYKEFSRDAIMIWKHCATKVRMARWWLFINEGLHCFTNIWVHTVNPTQGFHFWILHHDPLSQKTDAQNGMYAGFFQRIKGTNGPTHHSRLEIWWLHHQYNHCSHIEWKSYLGPWNSTCWTTKPTGRCSNGNVPGVFLNQSVDIWTHI